MTIQPTVAPARAARRQLLTDRIAEYLTEKCGSEERGTAYARHIVTLVEEQGWSLPPGLDDPPPLRPDRGATDEAREAAMAKIRADLATRKAGR